MEPTSLCSTGNFSNMSGGLVCWPKESTKRIILRGNIVNNTTEQGGRISSVPGEGQSEFVLLRLLAVDHHDAVRGALLELQAGHGLLNAGVAQVQELLGTEILQVDLGVLGCSDQDGVVGDEDGLRGLVGGEFVPQHEVSPLLAPLQDGDQMVVSGTEVHLTLQTSNEI